MKMYIILSILAAIMTATLTSAPVYADNGLKGDVSFAKYGGGGFGFYLGPSYGSGYYGPYGTFGYYGDDGGYGYYNVPDRLGNTKQSCVWNGYEYKCYNFTR